MILVRHFCYIISLTFLQQDFPYLVCIEDDIVSADMNLHCTGLRDGHIYNVLKPRQQQFDIMLPHHMPLFKKKMFSQLNKWMSYQYIRNFMILKPYSHIANYATTEQQKLPVSHHCRCNVLLTTLLYIYALCEIHDVTLIDSGHCQK